MCLVKLLLCHIPRILENPSKYIFLLQNYHSDFLEQCFSNFSKYFTWRSPIIYFLCLQPLVQCVGAWVVESVCVQHHYLFTKFIEMCLFVTELSFSYCGKSILYVFCYKSLLETLVGQEREESGELSLQQNIGYHTLHFGFEWISQACYE